VHGLEADGLGDFALVADIDFARGVVADEHRRKSRNDAVIRFQLRRLGGDAHAQFRGEGLAVNDGCAHCTFSMASSRAATGAGAGEIWMVFRRAASPPTMRILNPAIPSVLLSKAMSAVLASPFCGATETR